MEKGPVGEQSSQPLVLGLPVLGWNPVGCRVETCESPGSPRHQGWWGTAADGAGEDHVRAGRSSRPLLSSTWVGYGGEPVWSPHPGRAAGSAERARGQAGSRGWHEEAPACGVDGGVRALSVGACALNAQP